ncbi:MAG: glutamate racemase [Thermoanaerobaculia bacterium]|nr:glutamate racemase [Thermoanaerobaculia bacterium]
MSDSRPIGVFDSGVGGLTVVAALRRRLPQESVLYLGDTARLPYGTKSPETVRRYSQRNVEFLASRGVKGVVIACNTASAVALDSLVEEVPIWGVIAPGAECAANLTHGRVGILATESTITSDAYGRALRSLDKGLEIFSQACPLFVPLIEEGWLEDAVTEAVAQRYLAPLVAAQVDTVVLGCTHYPLLAPLIGRLMGPRVQLVDSAVAVVDRLAEDLERSQKLAGGESDSSADNHYCVTDGGERFRRIAGEFLGDPGISLEWVEVL